MAEHTFYKKPDWVFDSGLWGHLSETEKDVFEVFCRYSDGNNEAFCGISELRKQTGHCRNGILDARRKLLEIGILKQVGVVKGRGTPCPAFRINYEAQIGNEQIKGTV